MNPATSRSREIRLRDLMVAAQRGDAAAYAGFLREMASLLRPFFRRRLTQHPDDVEDLVQETLLAVHNKRAYLRSGAAGDGTWMYAIARYKLVDLLRATRRSRSTARPTRRGYSMNWLPTPSRRRRKRGAICAVLLAQLPDKQRLPIEYVKIEGLSVDETARLTGLSVSAVKVGVHRGLKALAARIRNER